METTADKKLKEVKEKLESLLVQLDKAKTDGEETALVHQKVVNIVEKPAKDDKALTQYVDIVKEQINKTVVQLSQVRKRIEAGKRILAFMENAENVKVLKDLLVFIGAEQPEEDEKKEA